MMNNEKSPLILFQLNLKRKRVERLLMSYSLKKNIDHGTAMLSA